MRNKIIFFDIDGTLVNYKGAIPESTKQALKLLKENNHLRFVCTGRTKAMLPKSILEIDFDGYVFGAGTHVEYQNEELFYHEVSTEDLEKTMDIMREYSFLFTLEGRDCLYVDKDSFMDDSSAFGKFVKGMGKIVKPLEELSTVHISKITCFIPAEEQHMIPMITEAFETLYQVIVHETMEEKDLTQGLVELVPHQCDKATGIRKCIEHLNISREDTFAFGDSNNDLQMLSYVKTSICMGNGNAKAKEVSDYITSSIEDDGIYEGLKHFGLL